MTMRERYTRWRRYRRLVRELSDFQHHELVELGIATADIERVAYDAVYRAPTSSEH